MKSQACNPKTSRWTGKFVLSAVSATMTKKIVFTLLALVATALPAAAQNQFLTSYVDSTGTPHIYYQAYPSQDLWQIAPFHWSVDMNQLTAFDGFSGPAINLPPPVGLSPLASSFGSSSSLGPLQHAFYINNLGNMEHVGIDSSGVVSALPSAPQCYTGNNGVVYGTSIGTLVPPPTDGCVAGLDCPRVGVSGAGCNPDGKSLTGFASDSGPSVFWTGKDGSVYHNYLDPDVGNLAPPFFFNMSTAAGVTPNSACGVVSSRLAALSDTRFSPNQLLVFYVSGSGHLCELVQVPGTCSYRNCDSFTNSDLTAICESAPCGDGAPQPMLKSPITGFTDSGGVHVFYLDASGHVNEFVIASSGVSNLNLWNRVVCPPQYRYFNGRLYPVVYPCYSPSAVADSLTSFTNAFGPQVFYVDTNGDVNQINLMSNTHRDLTASFGGSPAVQAKTYSSAYDLCTVGTSLSSIGVDNLGGEDVYYIDAAWHVSELHSGDSSTWLGGDLTQTFGTPNALVVQKCPN